jgi:S1-C subfamily serine protease
MCCCVRRQLFQILQLICFAVFAGEACSQPALERFVAEHEQKRTNRAIALAIDGDGGWAAGAYYGAWTIRGAIDAALERCNSKREENRVRATCQIYSINGNISYDTLANLIARARREHQARVASLRASQERAALAAKEMERESSAQRSVEAFAEFYGDKPGNNAVALAMDRDGRWAGGAYNLALSVEAAIDGAMSMCRQSREKNRVQALCQIYSVNGNVSGESLAKLKERERREYEDRLAADRAAQQREREIAAARERAAKEQEAIAAKEREREVRKQNISAGTGFLVSGQGHVLTANHVLGGSTAVFVRTPTGEVMPAQVLAVSQNLDVALIKIPFAAAHFIALAHTPVRLLAGDRVFTFGFPVTAVLGDEPKYSDGAISSVSGIQGDVAFLQVTVPIQPGSSGGPLIREDGTLAGVLTSSAAIVPFVKLAGTLPQNINWATNINAAMPLLLDVPRIAERQKLDRAALIRKVRQSVVYIEAQK